MLCVTCQLSPVACHLAPVTCHMSPVTCHLSPVTCHLSPVTCHLSPVTCQQSAVSCQLSPVTCHFTSLMSLTPTFSEPKCLNVVPLQQRDIKLLVFARAGRFFCSSFQLADGGNTSSEWIHAWL